MSRVKLQKGQQRLFLTRVAKYFDFDWSKMAKISNICGRSLRDWRREKYNIRYESLLKLHNVSNIRLPKIIEILPEYWSAKKFARKGALKRYQIYGDFGTPEGRRKGGLNAQKIFRLHPEYAKNLGINIRKEIGKPRLSAELAEFIGIMLGDGGITNYQINITFNADTDNDYGVYVQRLIKELFSISTSIILTSSDKGNRIVASSKNLVDFLEKKGLKRGNKVKNKINIPRWILNNKNYSKYCLRGLIDTDGSFYQYRHKVFNKIYCNFAICFTNCSKPLLRTVSRILRDLGFTPVISTKRVYLYKKKEIDRYFSEVGTNNLKHRKKYNNYLAYCNANN